MTRLRAPALRSWIFTYVPTVPVYVQLMVWLVPGAHVSPPFGLVTVMGEDGVLAEIVK
jgi:hypothetical protein